MTEEIMISDLQEKFQDFFKQDKYRRRISEIAVNESESLIVDFDDLLVYDPILAENLIDKPDEYMLYCNLAALAQLRIEASKYAETVEKVTVRFRKLPLTTSLRALGSKNIGKLIMIEGIVVRATPAQPLVTLSAFKCKRCGKISYVKQSGPFLTFPSECADPSCRRRGPFDFVQEESKFIDYQDIRVQERPEDLPPGQLPRWVDVSLQGRDIVDKAR
ncbi:MAG: hypothetical protein QXL67_02980, partial [Candidatus Bathyarchaeia archaeon]